MLDKLLEEPNIYYASVPGAGGDDAIFVLSPKDSPPLQETTTLKQNSHLAVLPVSVLSPGEKALKIEFN